MTDIPVQNARALNTCQANACAHCCYDTEMLLSESDIRRLEAAGHDREGFTKIDEDGYAQLRNVYPGHERFSGTTGRAADWEDPNEGDEPDPETGPTSGGHCWFLKDGVCSAYTERPQGCRIYPWTLDLTGTRAVRDEECPHREEFPSESALQRRMRQHLNVIVREAQTNLKRAKKAKKVHARRGPDAASPAPDADGGSDGAAPASPAPAAEGVPAAGAPVSRRSKRRT